MIPEIKSNFNNITLRKQVCNLFVCSCSYNVSFTKDNPGGEFGK